MNSHKFSVYITQLYLMMMSDDIALSGMCVAIGTAGNER